MKYALHTVSYSGTWPGQYALPLEGAIKKAAGFGYKGVEIMAKRPHASVLDMDKARVKRVKKLLSDGNLECACIAGYTDFLLGAGTMVPSIEMQIAHVTRLAEMASDFGCGLVRVFTGYNVNGLSYLSQWGIVLDALRECARRSAGLGVTIGLQNHHDIGADTAGMLDLIAEIGEPNVKAMYDAWAPALQGENLAEAVKAMAPHIVYTTVADYVKKPRWRHAGDAGFIRGDDIVRAVPMGEGVIAYAEFFNALKSAGYDGWVSYEICSPVRGGGAESNLDLYAKQFLDYMAKF